MQLNQIHHKKIYYAVLNWGLGHATRSAHILKQLLAQQNKLTVFSTGLALHYLKKEFPKLSFVDFNTTDIIYPKHSQLWASLVLQYKKINRIIQNDNLVFTHYCYDNGDPDLFISDNCYGFYSTKIPSILITHQVNIKSPLLQKQAQKIIHGYIKKFSAVWIPDVEGDLNLAGELARPIFPNTPCTFIGPLSNLQLAEPTAEKKFAYCAIISGPEKQRTLFEQNVFHFLNDTQLPSLLIRGTTTKHQYISNTVTVIDFAQANTLNEYIANSETIIARSGYSTIMDMFLLKKPCILVPTPGQTEQEYLFHKHFPSQNTDIKTIKPVTIILCRG